MYASTTAGALPNATGAGAAEEEEDEEEEARSVALPPRAVLPPEPEDAAAEDERSNWLEGGCRDAAAAAAAAEVAAAACSTLIALIGAPLRSDLTRSAYRKVLSVCSHEAEPGAMAAIMTVRELPTKLSFNT